jgi:phosphonate transport system permease protein
VWTFLWALIIISGFADRLSSLIRRRRNRTAVAWRGSDRESAAAPADPVLRSAVALGAAAIPVAYWWLSIDLTTLWAPRARQLAGELVRDSIPPRVGAGGLAELLRDAGDTVALAVLSIVLAWGVASILAFPASRTHRHRIGIDRASRRLLTALTRFVLLVSRSVPPPVWALVVVFVLFPGLWPGAVALAIYNAGVLGRLQSEVIENLDRSPEDVLRSSGASSLGAILLATVPALGGRFVALGLYRWEVAIRETVVVGVVGAAGLGRRLDEQTSSFDYQGILATILALIVVTLAVDVASASMRRSVR